MLKDIVIRGAKENNLKDISVTIPRNKLVVFTGVSGSGKSTLAFDTIFAEGQRRYMESLSSYARQFLGQMSKPNVEFIDGLSPAISIDQKTTSSNPRSTVGTVTEIYDYLRLLFAHVGTPYCPNCNTPITTQTIDAIIAKILQYPKDSKIMVLAEFVKGKKGRFEHELQDIKKDGFVRVIVDDVLYSLDDEIVLDKNIKHTIYIVVDRLIIKPDIEKRLTESVETALKAGRGKVVIDCDGLKELFSTTHACAECGFSMDELAPRMFSFNSPFGACPECNGLGFKQLIDIDKIIPDKNKSLAEGAITISAWAGDKAFVKFLIKSVASHYGVSLDVPVKDLPKEVIDTILFGTKGEKIGIRYYSHGIEQFGTAKFEGVIPNIEKKYRESTNERSKEEIQKLMVTLPCPLCHGKRLKQEALSVKIKGKNITEVTDMSVADLIEFFAKLKLNNSDEQIAQPILKEVNARLNFLKNVGLEYLTLSRLAGTLSGGESQRIRLATQIGSGLTGVVYILDEPSIGLHQHDNAKLLKTLTNLRDLGNTVIVVEHDEDTMRTADYLVDIGPYAGVHGGEVVATGSVKDIISAPRSVTGKYLSGELSIGVPSTRREPKGYIELNGCKHNNLKNVNAKFPIGVITAVTGVSGSGKSSLVSETLYPVVYNALNGDILTEGAYKNVKGIEQIDKIISIDQAPIGKTPRSNPATYTGVFSEIRALFASTIDAKERGYNAGRFSFNVPGGRCENCVGAGINKIEMYFLPDVYVPCDECGGKRYNNETLKVKYKGKSIYDVLEMTIEEANQFFENIPRIKNKLQTLVDVGLGYIKLGQPATELSGGEAQRVKLATELSKKNTTRTLYVLDEPTTGLHSYDVHKLIAILNRLADAGNTIVVIEHNLDIINNADYIIDMGPEGGNNGGYIQVCGTPEQVAKSNIGYTSKYIKPIKSKK